MDIINFIIVIASIGLGLFGWLAPAYTMKTLDIHKGETSMGPSEIRASAGALFIGLGLGAWLIGTPEAYAMIGCAWGGAAIGRLTSLVLDGTNRKKWVFFGTEAVVAVLALWNNLL